MTWQTVPLASVPPQPWKNGGGTTRELLAWPPGADWRVRLSVAEVVADGPFSRFDGVQRWFAVLGGAGVRLAVDGVAHKVTAADAPLAFDGAADTHCTLLGGPTQDFNLMLRGGSARVQRAQGRLQVTPGASKVIAIYIGNTGGSVGFGTENEAFAAHTLLWREVSATAPTPPITLGAPGALWMEISP